MIKYVASNLAKSTLDLDISASATSVALKAGDWNLFPAEFPYMIKIEKFVSWAVTKREMLKVTWKNWDTLSVVRAWEYCPASDSAQTQTKTAQSFSKDDSVTLIVTAQTIREIQDEVENLWTNKLNKANWKRTWLWVSIVLVSWSDWVETELSWTEWKVLTFHWANPPTAETPSVDIVSLPSASTVADSDYMIVNIWWSNKKVSIANVRKWINTLQALTVSKVSVWSSSLFATWSSTYYSNAVYSDRWTFNYSIQSIAVENSWYWSWNVTATVQISRDWTTWTDVDSVTNTTYNYGNNFSPVSALCFWYVDGWLYARIKLTRTSAYLTYGGANWFVSITN